MLVTHKDDILRQFTLVALETQSSFTLVQFSLGFYDRWAQNVAGSPVIQPKAGAVKASELSSYYSSIYISGSLSPCSRVCTLHTLAALHICYTLEAQRSFARVCYIHSLSPSLSSLNHVLDSCSSPPHPSFLFEPRPRFDYRSKKIHMQLEQRRFQRNLYLRVVGMWQGVQREAGFAHTTYGSEEEGVGGPPAQALGERE